MASFDPERYESARKKAYDFYGNVQSVTSPLLGSIHFNSDGFMHLLFEDDERREKRDWKNQMKRFELLVHVPDVLKRMTHCQEYFEVMKSVETKMNKQRMRTVKVVRYWGFVAIIRNYQRRIKIVVRQVGDGNIHFWSIIPYWTRGTTKTFRELFLRKETLSVIDHRCELVDPLSQEAGRGLPPTSSHEHSRCIRDCASTENQRNFLTIRQFYHYVCVERFRKIQAAAKGKTK